MIKKLAPALAAALLAFLTTGCAASQQKAQARVPDQQKLQALDNALKNGLITQAEYNAKLQTIRSDRPATRTARTANVMSGQMKTVEVYDPFFQEKAFTLRIPADWNYAGTILRSDDGAYQLVFRAESKDGLTGVQKMPEYNWGTSPGSLQSSGAGPVRAADFIQKTILKDARPGAQVEAVEPVPELAEKLAEQNRATEQKLAASAAPGRAATVQGDVARVRITYQFNGHPEEEWIFAVVTTQEIPFMQGAVYRNHAVVWGSRAPRGQLESLKPVFDQIGASTADDPAWRQRQIQFFCSRHRQDPSKSAPSPRT